MREAPSIVIAVGPAFLVVRLFGSSMSKVWKFSTSHLYHGARFLKLHQIGVILSFHYTPSGSLKTFTAACRFITRL